MAKGHQQPMRGAAPRETPKSSGLVFPALKIRIRHVGGLLLALLVAWGVFAGASVMKDQPLPVPQWAVSAVEFDQVLLYQEATQFDELLATFQGRSLLTHSVQDIKNEVESLPWIATAEIQVLWPDVLHIAVVEERPIAIWNGTQLISQTGKLFEADTKIFDLPRLSGDTSSIEAVMTNYLNFNRSLLGFGHIVHQLQLSSGGSWTLTTEKGLVIRLGGSDVLARFNRALHFMEETRQQLHNIDYIDARYHNGIAYKLIEKSGARSV